MTSDGGPYDALIAPIERRMTATVSRIARDPDDAADALQEALAKVWQNLETIRAHPNPHGYILRICMTCAYDGLRKKSRRRERELPLLDGARAAASPAPGAARELAARERIDRTLRTIEELPHAQREAVLMRLVQEESFAFIGRALGCAEATARSHYSKGCARLRKILEERDAQPRRKDGAR